MKQLALQNTVLDVIIQAGFSIRNPVFQNSSNVLHATLLGQSCWCPAWGTQTTPSCESHWDAVVCRQPPSSDPELPAARAVLTHASVPSSLAVQPPSRVRLFATPRTVATRLLCPWDSPGNHALLQRVFPTQEWSSCLLCLLHWQVDSLPLGPLGKPVINMTWNCKSERER